MRKVCVACGQSAKAPLLHFSAVPASGIYLGDDWGDAGEPFPRRDLTLVYCRDCGLASKVEAAASGLDYTQIDRGTAQQMPDHAGGIVQMLREAGLAQNSSILEVGSNDGSFLAFLADHGFSRLKGIEPSRELAAIATAKGFDIETGYCTAGGADAMCSRYGAFDAIVCRHTLEHVPDPADLLAAIALLLRRGGVALIEVPDFDWVIERLAVHEIWDEHVSYFSRANLSRALVRYGFDVVSCAQIRFRDTRNLVALARMADAAAAPVDKPRQGDSTTAAACALLSARWQALVADLGDRAPHWPRPVYAIGASHIQSNFVHFSGLARVVGGFIDDDPRKGGKRVMLEFPVPVVTTRDVLETMQCGTLLRTAFPYPGWMDTICDALSTRGVEIVDPYAGVPRSGPVEA